MNPSVKRLIPLDVKNGCVEIAHGSGGASTTQLIEHIFHRHFHNDILLQSDDYAQLNLRFTECAMSTDSFVISPLFFPGGDIGSLSIHGTVNDLAMSGYQPQFLSVGFILEEGFPLLQLDQIVASMAKAAQDAGVKLVTGDTKVVERGKGDGVFINTTGIASPYEGHQNTFSRLSGSEAKAGDVIVLSGSIGDHGIAVMANREGLEFETTIQSDAASLNHMIKEMLDTSTKIHCLRDPTRGGLASTLNEIASQSNVGVYIDESTIPVQEQVQGACEFLGLDPLYIANEGKLVCICEAGVADALLGTMKSNVLGEQAAIIGHITSEHRGQVVMQTKLGGRRLVDTMVGEQLPRIC